MTYEVLGTRRSRVGDLIFMSGINPKAARLAVSRSERLKKMVCDTEADPRVMDKWVEIFKLEKDLGSTAQGNENFGHSRKETLEQAATKRRAVVQLCFEEACERELRTQ